MVSVEKWAMWDSAVEVDVTEGAALPTAHALIASAIDETEAVCDLRRGDAEIHAVNLAQGTPVKVTRRMSALLRSALWAARMTGGAVNPLADNFSEDESIPPVHPTPTFEDVQLDGDVVYAPWCVVRHHRSCQGGHRRSRRADRRRRIAMWRCRTDR